MVNRDGDKTVLPRGEIAVENLMREETEAATQEILEYLDSHGDVPVTAVKSALGRRELDFYTALGNLILRHLVTIQERREVFWAIRIPHMAKAA
jgi:hypothetical protein